MSESLQDPVQTHTELLDNMVSTITIENYLKDLMAIPRPRVDNSELLDGIDSVANNLSDCINLAESTLRKKKLGIKHKEATSQSQRTGDVFSGLDRIDDKLASCIKLAEEKLKQDDSEFEIPWTSMEHNLRSNC